MKPDRPPRVLPFLPKKHPGPVQEPEPTPPSGGLRITVKVERAEDRRTDEDPSERA